MTFILIFLYNDLNIYLVISLKMNEYNLTKASSEIRKNYSNNF